MMRGRPERNIDKRERARGRDKGREKRETLTEKELDMR